MADERVLVVEDNDFNFQLTQALLRRMGLTVIRASTGDEGLAMATSESHDLIVMDIQLPGLDGLALTRLLRSNPATQATPILGLSALAMSGDPERGLAAGCDAYLTKPLAGREFQEVVRQLLTRSR